MYVYTYNKNADAEREVYTQWKLDGDCKRPTSGECSLAQTCCNQEKGIVTFTRKCKMDSKCHADALNLDPL